MLLDGSPILLHTVRKFAASDRVSEIVIALRREDLEAVGELLRHEITKPGDMDLARLFLEQETARQALS
jgi:2-C-methyl-D-erythritol 4-phosphate cytidylyltransferase